MNDLLVNAMELKLSFPHQHGAHCEQLASFRTCIRHEPFTHLPSRSELARVRVYQRKLHCSERIQPLEISEEISVELLCFGLFDVFPEKMCVCVVCSRPRCRRGEGHCR
jgi:hypothetical protein